MPKHKRNNNLDDTCPICLFPLKQDESITLPCGHIFHKLCYANLLANERRNIGNLPPCPMCRAPLPDNNIIEVINDIEPELISMLPYGIDIVAQARIAQERRIVQERRAQERRAQERRDQERPAEERPAEAAVEREARLSEYERAREAAIRQYRSNSQYSIVHGYDGQSMSEQQFIEQWELANPLNLGPEHAAEVRRRKDILSSYTDKSGCVTMGGKRKTRKSRKKRKLTRKLKRL